MRGGAQASGKTMLRIYNTLTKKKEPFEPKTPGKVGMYVCGPTVYDACHIGHARSVVVFDVMARYFRAGGYDVNYVRNFTDVDDKIINRANDLGVSTQELSQKYIDLFYEDMKALNVEQADEEPKATEHIADIIDVVQRLVDRGHAYEAGGDVFFAVESFKDYGKLSGRKLEEMQAGARVEIDERKRNPFDFVLWKAAKPGEPMWDSPWGPGRPGWHIECSAMSTRFLGSHFDIHGGGQDLIFPHHENELAQSEGAFGPPVINFWIHNGFVRINQEKMSKSLGNFLLIKDIVKRYHPEAVRLFLLSNHYRSPVDFTEQAIIEAESGLEKIYALLQRIDEEIGVSGGSEPEQGPGLLWEKFCEAMDDDFNSALVMGHVFETVRRTNRLMDDLPGEPGPDEQATLRSARADLGRVGSVLGFLSEDPVQFFEQRKSNLLKSKGVDVAAIERLVEERTQARGQKDWAAADRIRDELAAMGVEIKDGAGGTAWKMK
jgi:cysteinyl-tRNA synthetase